MAVNPSTKFITIILFEHELRAIAAAFREGIDNKDKRLDVDNIRKIVKLTEVALFQLIHDDNPDNILIALTRIPEVESEGD